MYLPRAEGQNGSPASPCGVRLIGIQESVERYSRALLAANRVYKPNLGSVDLIRNRKRCRLECRGVVLRILGANDIDCAVD